MPIPKHSFTTALLASCALPLTACAQSQALLSKTPFKTEAPTKLSASSVTPADPYFVAAQQTLQTKLATRPITTKAKNVILFVADGMGPTTVTAARIYIGQANGLKGEEHVLAFEKLPHLAMAKTYNTNMQTPDSAGTATAMMTGVKTKMGVINVTGAVEHGNCQSGLDTMALSIGELSEQAGMSTGVVSTARLTHATPATVYAHSPDRGWENDTNLPEDAIKCKDIARQLIEMPYGDGLEVALGGGRRNFITSETADPEYPTKNGRRKDGRNLITEWTNAGGAYAWNLEQFEAAGNKQKLLGLFQPSHMQYEADRAQDEGGEPSLAEMTEKSIRMLSNNKEGYFLMVEGGRIDHAHHRGNAARALKDAEAFDAAVAKAVEMTNVRDTLIIVTADHAHTLAFQGYPERGNPILGLVKNDLPDFDHDEKNHVLARDKKPYTTLTYANGPGSPFKTKDVEISRPKLTDEIVADPDYQQQAIVPSGSETHGGQDVTIYASGPQAYLFDSTVEQNYIFHVIDHALDLRKRAK